MSDREPHCPFLNRADGRCSSYFSIERLQHAFGHCFHAYKTCGVYGELLAERQTRRGQAAAGAPAGDAGVLAQFVWTSACRPAERDAAKPTRAAQRPFVQIRLPGVAAAAREAAAGAGPHAPA